MTELEIGDAVLCTVDRIVGTTVFVILETGEEGSIVLSEIAPGRIRNLRDYVVPKKKIVCKVLRKDPTGMIYLSLRRVSQKEKKEVIEQENLKKSYTSVLKTILKEKAEKIIEEIKKETSIYEFLNESKENPKKLEKLVGKNDAEKILEILKKEKEKKVLVKKEISLTSNSSNGLELVKKILGHFKEIDIRTISAGRYSLKIESTDAKKAETILRTASEEIETQAKKLDMNFSKKD